MKIFPKSMRIPSSTARTGAGGCPLLGTESAFARFPDGRLLAADAACPHKGARLSADCIRHRELMCPYHGWRFGAAGASRVRWAHPGCGSSMLKRSVAGCKIQARVRGCDLSLGK
jgi:phenylpropionate dioxygenase-like ring-hydroxylating dioxygenase large terminal subunit